MKRDPDAPKPVVADQSVNPMDAMLPIVRAGIIGGIRLVVTDLDGDRR